MHIPPPLHLTLLFASLASSTITGPETPSRFPQVPSPVTTPAPDRDLVTHRLLRARQGPPRSSDGRTNFIGWYTASDTWVSATCPSESYFAADETYGVCCPRNNANCDLATVCGGANNNFAVGPSGLADCGPSNTCDTVTVIQTKGSDDARRIIFCIARSEQYVLPMTWYRVTYPLPQTDTVTVTRDTTVTATAQTTNSTASRSGISCVYPPSRLTAAAVVAISLISLMT